MEFRGLPADAPERQQLARWYHAEWGQDAGLTVEQELQRLNPPQDAEGFPHLIAVFDDGQVVGAVQLKRREMQAFPQYEHWLGSVFVADSHRGRGLAGALVEQAAAQAVRMGVSDLYLQTEALDGGLYARLGWKPLEEADNRSYRVLVMVRRLAA
ncbi:GNAT family N-acetyltransferase [Stenotrophomonas maltophilia]|uniref:Acetyltransferase n=1 Tax=Stenotrophomonas maltophilia (strain K279a) TaxID=522373 RepID=B2FSK5_STRMK|nr:GNAT family N-acetyltransferase [Stenotrophomonas maltophilia]EKT4069287.1 GNAT family N-acetyltransferase [Stenotrophomonas maltophilia]EKT4077995.1 GNAT family N-acetyltransferase [Stenotrophomonas maltophilia]EKU9965192.1 GNAT family N-acetyltransferase [Stenotrophomonas maltophilia]KUJ01622.1 acetyltransferase [Stenotrophomonas maltophilia]MBA0229046.1 GNAT family N-acetyltransferase [Stenotrophomonas maltophilia]